MRRCISARKATHRYCVRPPEAMHFEGEFKVPGKAEDVIRRFADVPRMSRCMPGAVLEPQAEDGSWPGAMVVSFGPKKVNFKGRVTTAFDLDALTGTLNGRGSADMRAARIGVKVNFTLRDAVAVPVPTTVVSIVSDAELGGVLADFARTGGVAVANVIMADFARRAAAEFAQDDAPPAVEASIPDAPASAVGTTFASAPMRVLNPQEPAPARYAEPVPLAAHTLLWAVIKAQLVRFRQWLRPTR